MTDQTRLGQPSDSGDASDASDPTEAPQESEPSAPPSSQGTTDQGTTDGSTPQYPAPDPGARPKADLRSAMTERFALFFRYFADRFFSHFSLDPEVVDRLKGLEERGSVVYVMRYSSRLDYFLFNSLFLRHGLRLSSFANAIHFYYYRPVLPMLKVMTRLKRGRPREVEHSEDQAAVREHVAAGHSLFIFLRTQRLRSFLKRRKTGNRSDELDLIGEVVRRIAESTNGTAGDRAPEVSFVPLAIFWTKGPRTQNRFMNVDYGALTRPSDFVKVARFLSTYRSLTVKVGEAVDVRAAVDVNRAEGGEADWQLIARKIRRAILIHLYREEKVVEGPTLRPRWRVLREVLEDRGVREAMEVRAQSKSGSAEKAEREVEKIFREISADMSSIWLAIGAATVGGLFRRLFASIEVHRLAEVAEDAKRHPIVLVPSHRSYFDFLILSWLFYQNYMVPPHIAARENMAFGPFGFLFRRMGAFFLRKSFDDALYKEVFRAYVGFLVREGFTQEFFIEGGRSRTGKALAPRLGMLGWDVDAFLESRRRDLFFVPIAISYERLVEESGMIEELDGGAKSEESVIGLLRARKYLQRRFGSVHVSFGEPVSLAAALGGQRDSFEALQRGQIDSLQEREKVEERKREFVESLGLSLVERIGWAMVANATSVAAVVLLGSSHSGMLRESMVKRMRGVAGLLQLQGVRLTPAFERDLQWDLRESIAFLDRSDLIEAREDQRGEILHFEESRRRALDIYRNSIAHFLVIPSIVARSVLARKPKSELQNDLRDWFDVFYREYYVSQDFYLTRGEAVADHFTAEGWTRAETDRWEPTPAGLEILTAVAEQTRGVIEFYDTATRVLLRAGGEGTASQLLKQTLQAFENAKILGTARRAEASTDSSFNNCMAWLESRGIVTAERIAAGKRGVRDTRYARGDRWSEFESIRTLLASALTDR
jgi:glycerol-3-phosphate O-acyltransferase